MDCSFYKGEFTNWSNPSLYFIIYSPFTIHHSFYFPRLQNRYQWSLSQHEWWEV